MAMRKAGEAPGKPRGGVGRVSDTGQFAVQDKAGRKSSTTTVERMPKSGGGRMEGIIDKAGVMRERVVEAFGEVRLDAGMVAKIRQGVVITRAKLKQSGGSLIFTVPAPARRAMSLSAGDEVDVTVDQGRMVLEPVVQAKPPMRVRRPKYTIEELVEGYNADAPLSAEEREWMDAPPVGREIW